MARLPTTNAALLPFPLLPLAPPSSDSLEVVIDRTGSDEEELMTTSFANTRRPVTSLKKKLNGAWTQLATLSSADLVQELKVKGGGEA